MNDAEPIINGQSSRFSVHVGCIPRHTRAYEIRGYVHAHGNNSGGGGAVHVAGIIITFVRLDTRGGWARTSSALSLSLSPPLRARVRVPRALSLPPAHARAGTRQSSPVSLSVSSCCYLIIHLKRIIFSRGSLLSSLPALLTLSPSRSVLSRAGVRSLFLYLGARTHARCSRCDDDSQHTPTRPLENACDGKRGSQLPKITESGH